LQNLGITPLKKSEESIKQVSGQNNLLDEANISELTKTTLPEIIGLHEQIKSTLSDRLSALDDQILAKKQSSVSPEQLKDIHETFKFFDKNGNSKLSFVEFKAACASVGTDLPDDELGKIFNKYDKGQKGNLNFEEFVLFMSSIVKEGSGYDDLMISLKEITGGKDSITESQIRSNLDDKAVVDHLLKNLPKNQDGSYNYKKYFDDQFGK